LGHDVYFTAITRFPSTINRAEQIIIVICEAEGIDWRECSFFDIQTTWGYPSSGRDIFDYNVDKLVLMEGTRTPSVVDWKTIAMTPGWNPYMPELDKIEEVIPEAVIKAFQDLLIGV
jgi:hypothetical protein